MKIFAWLRRAGVLALLFAILAACQKPNANGRQTVKFYQCPMHPWITSDKPGNCTICGMVLVPVYEGEAGAAAANHILTLQNSTMQVLGVATVPMRHEQLTRTLHFSGIFEDDDNRHRVIAAFYDGRIERVYVNHVGEYLEKGSPLAAIYSPELLYVVREYQNAVRGGNQEIARTSAKRLVQYGLSPEQVTKLTGQKEPAYTIDLLSPISGTVLVRKAYQGQYIKTGEPLFEMGDLSRLWFHAEVYERDLPGVKIGQKAIITSPAVPGREFEGTVTFVDPNFDPNSRSTKVRIEVENPVIGTGEHGQRYILSHRSYAEARIQASLGEGFILPRSAVLRDGKRSVAYVEKTPGSYELREVETGRVGDEGIEILDGVKENERVVVQGNLMIDAETQLRGFVQASAAASPAENRVAPPGASKFLAQLAKLSDSLAADDAVAAVVAARPLHEMAAAIAVEGNKPVEEAIRSLQSLHGTLQGGDLQAIRKAFLPWSQAGARLSIELIRAGSNPGTRVFECPMTGDSFPGAPDSARWIQTGSEVRNPYLGAEMLNCGSEVRP